jgi:hypothetical protein
MLTRIARLTLIACGVALWAGVASAGWADVPVIQDIVRNQCWPKPFVCADREAVRAPFMIQVANGWERQNMLSEYHFEPGTGELTEAGRLKVQWILLDAPQQHRVVFVHRSVDRAETAARMQQVMQYACRVVPDAAPAVLETSMPDYGTPAQRIDLIGRKYQSAIPEPKLPEKQAMGSGSSAAN